MLVAGTGEASAVVVCPPANSLSGVDVSSYNGTIDWNQVASAGYSFGYARVGDGTLFQDPAFQTNYAGMKAAGLKPGGYLFFEPAEDPHAQASVLLAALSTAGFAPGDLLPALDIEITGGLSPGALAASIQAAVNDIKAALGVSPVIYTGKGFWDNNLDSNTFGSPLWIAQWLVNCPNTPNAWTTWALWQYTDQGTVPGIPGATTLDRSFGPNLPLYMPPPALTISKTHTGNFPVGRLGTYTITVGNSGSGPTDGTTVTVHDTLPRGLTAVSLTGSGWSCTRSSLTCTRSNVLAAGNSYPPISLTVRVLGFAASQVTNTATVSGGGDNTTHTATDPTTITRGPGDPGWHHCRHHRDCHHDS
ncbi:GH25 family lysozyme [Streptomyces sp. NPDC056165]|uniref:GH25 family lysozyme n=1 Tax=Streptomyces sp. NPDC056165 TaxID=3345733 RepID=UPI0035DB6D33